MWSRWSAPSSTSKPLERSRSTPDAPIFSATRTRVMLMSPCRHPAGALRRSSASRLMFDDIIDARRQRLDVARLDRREHADPQLVAAELAVGLGVDDPV